MCQKSRCRAILNALRQEFLKCRKLNVFTGACLIQEIENRYHVSIEFYTINQVIRIQLVLAYDLLEDRHTIDVITTKFFFLHFKMAESFEK